MNRRIHEPAELVFPDNEIAKLILVVGRHYGFTDDEFRKAIHAAHNDTESALRLYRDLAQRISTGHRPT
jgi:hypothetical protein